MSLELSRQRMRRRALNRFNQIRTCVLARELCLLIRRNRAAFNTEDVIDCCSVVFKLCREAGCKEASELCEKAVEAISKNEKTYLSLCEQSCRKCGEARMPQRSRVPRSVPDRHVYVA